MSFEIFRWVFLISGIAVLAYYAVTGRFYVRGRKLITTRFHFKRGKLITEAGTDEPIRRSESPRDFWFVWGMAVFIFSVIIVAFFTVR